MKVRLLLPALLLAAGAARAQATLSYGPVVGGNLAKEHISGGVNADYRLDWLAGGQVELSWGKLAVQPSLLFSQKGFRISDEIDVRDASNLPTLHTTYHSSVQLGYLTLPVNVVYAPHGTNAGPQLFLGPYASLLLTARDKHTDLDDAPTFGTTTTHLPIANKLDATTNPYGYRRFDAGLQGGVGYRRAAFLLQASYSLGLCNTTPQYTYMGVPYTRVNGYNRSFQLSLAYLFTQAK